jgi:hydroxymethylbilane synthase
VATLRIATRGSDLALVQARHIAGRVKAELGADTELVVIKTTGDRLKGSLANQGGKGLFIKEIEEALLAGDADLAVHSAKDLPARVEDALSLVCFPPRADARDALVAREPGATLATLPERARIATGSARRTALLLAARPDLQVLPMRGNVPTRLGKLTEPGSSLDALVLACAGLDRLNLAAHISERVSVDAMLPAVCQGTLALEARSGSPAAQEIAALGSPEAAVTVAAERSFLAKLEGDCSVPLAAYAELSGERLRLRGLVASLDGRQIVRAEAEGSAADAEALGQRVADDVLAGGGGEILQQLRTNASS